MADSDEQPDAPHPGSILRTEFLEPLGLSANALALALRVPAPRISELVRGRRGMTPDTALRLAQAFGAPAASASAGRGMEKLWSRRPSTPM